MVCLNHWKHLRVLGAGEWDDPYNGIWEDWRWGSGFLKCNINKHGQSWRNCWLLQYCIGDKNLEIYTILEYPLKEKKEKSINPKVPIMKLLN